MSIECPCGCGIEGEQRKRAWRDGKPAHVKRCPCRRCVGSRQRNKARVREHQIALDTGGEREPLSGSISGIDGRAGSWVWEETGNQAIARGLRKWWDSSAVQNKIKRLMERPDGERRVLILTDEKPWLVIMPYESWVETVKEDE